LDRASDCATLHYLWIISALAHREICGLQMVLLAKPDRLVIGSILRSKLVFLVNVRPHRPAWELCGMHSAECVDIDNESNQVP